MEHEKLQRSSLRVSNRLNECYFPGDLVKEEMPLDYEEDYKPDNITMINSFICDCGKRIETPLFTWPHILIENNIKRKCDECQNKLPEENRQIKSRKTYKYKSKPKVFRCTECSYSCDRNSNLKTHMLTHTGDKPFKCSSCKYRCTQKAHLVKHMLTHTVDKPFKVKCSECGTNFKNNSDLDSHMSTHFQEKADDIYRCPDCWYGFSEKAEYDSHVIYCKHNLYKSKEIILNDHAMANYDEDFFSLNAIPMPYEITHPLITAEIRKNLQNKLSTLWELNAINSSAGIINDDITVGSLEGYVKHHTCDCGNLIDNLDYDKCTKCKNELEESMHIIHNKENGEFSDNNNAPDNNNSPDNTILLDDLEMVSIENDDNMLKCPYCEYKSNKKSNIKAHISTHAEDRPFKCEDCGHRCKHMGHLVNHMLTHTTKCDNKPFKCTHCEYKCDRVSNLKTHMLTHTGDKPFKCTNCSYRCTQKAHLIKHLQTHSNERFFKCSECDCSFRLKSQLNTHLKTHTIGFNAVRENENNNNEHNMNDLISYEGEHTEVIDTPSSLLVNELSMPITPDEDFEINTEKTNDNASECTCTTPSGVAIRKNKFGEYISTCILCRKKMTDSHEEKSNEFVDSNENSYDCSECDKTFDNRIKLQKHLQTHSGNKPFSCPHCPYRCDRKSNLNTHILTHTGDKPFACEICPHRSKQKAHLLKHMLTHTKERPFSCKECGKTFQRKMQLSKHKLLHKIM